MKYIFSMERMLNHISPAKMLLSFYMLAVIFSTTLLALPISYQPGVNIPFIDTVFVAVSALSVTGLTTVSIADTFSTTGLVFIMVILHLGAVGVMSFSTFLWLILGKKIGLSERRLIKQDQNQTDTGGMVELIRQIIYVLLVVEAISVLILGTYFLRYFPTAGQAYFQGFFSTISAISNNGFSLNNDSLIVYQTDYFVQLIVMFLIVFGAIGFPVLIEVKSYLFSKRHSKKKFRFSLFTKVTTSTFFLLIFVGTVFIYLLDMHKFMKGNGFLNNLFFSLFQSVSTRSGGLSTMDVSQLTEANQMFMSALMFIGASPSSAGGGIRTTTFALVVIFIITYARGGRKVKIFNREIYERDLLKAVTVMTLAIIMVWMSVFILSIYEPFTSLELLFEVTSAFGTVGLSLGITPELTTFSKIILMFLMFVGRIGIVTFLYTFRKGSLEDDYIRYPKERMIIG